MNFIGDIPGGSLRGESISHASLASDGASAAYGIGTDAQRFRVPQKAIIIGAYLEPTGANASLCSEASYRRYTVYNGGTGGAGTAVLGSLNLSATLASNVQRAYTMQTATSLLTVPAGAVIAISQVTVGGNHNGGTINPALIHHVLYRPLS